MRDDRPGIDQQRLAVDLERLIEDPGEPVRLERGWRFWLLFWIMNSGFYRPASSVEMPGDMAWVKQTQRGPPVVARARETALRRSTIPLLLAVASVPVVGIAQVAQATYRHSFLAGDLAPPTGMGPAGWLMIVVVIVVVAAIWGARPAIRRWDALWRSWSAMEGRDTAADRLTAVSGRFGGDDALLQTALLVFVEHPDDERLRLAATRRWAVHVAQAYGWSPEDDGANELEAALAPYAPGETPL